MAATNNTKTRSTSGSIDGPKRSIQLSKKNQILPISTTSGLMPYQNNSNTSNQQSSSQQFLSIQINSGNGIEPNSQ